MLLIALVLIIGGTLFGMQHWQSRTDAQTTQAKAERHVTMVVKHDGKEKTLKKGETLLDLAQNEKREPKMSVTADGFITEIDGRAQNQVKNQYWVYTVNGKQTSEAPADLKFHSGDRITFELKQF